LLRLAHLAPTGKSRPLLFKQRALRIGRFVLPLLALEGRALLLKLGTAIWLCLGFGELRGFYWLTRCAVDEP
jgi:hypothetical protein